MPRLKQLKPIPILLAVLLVSGLGVYILFHPSRGQDDAGSGPYSLPAGEPLATDPGDLAAPNPDADPMESRTVRVRPQPRGDVNPAGKATQATLAKDVEIEDYKADLWAEIQADPPEFRSPGDPTLDADTAYRLYMYYGNCSVMLSRGHQVDQQIEKIVNRAATADDTSLEKLEGQLDQILDYYELCLPIPGDVDSRKEAVLWLSEAVRLGHEIAEIQFYEKAMGFLLRPDPNANNPPLAMKYPELVAEFKTTARTALAHALEKGHPEAYLAQSQALLEGLIYPRDPLRAYAYARLAELEAARSHLILHHVSRAKQEAARYLGPEQIAEAEQLAHELKTAGSD